MKLLAAATHQYHDIHKEFPAESYFNGTIFADDRIDKAHTSFRARLLPFIEMTALWEQLESMSDEQGSIEDLALHKIPDFFCPSNTKHLVDIGCTDGANRYASHYYGIAGAIGFDPDGKFYSVDDRQPNVAVERTAQERRGASLPIILGPFANTGTIIIGGGVTLDSITDGTSNTLLLGEISWSDYGAHFNWIRGTVISNAENPITALASSKGMAKNFPINAGKKSESLKLVLDESGKEYDVPVRGRRAGHGIGGFGSNHTGGANFVHADGSVRFYSETTDTTLLMHMSTRDGGETVAP